MHIVKGDTIDPPIGATPPAGIVALKVPGVPENFLKDKQALVSLTGQQSCSVLAIGISV